MKNKIKYNLKRIIRKSYYLILSILSMFILCSNVNASTIGPANNILEFQWLNGNTQNASATQLTRFNQLFYYHTSTSQSNYRGLFAFVNNNIYGNYFSFSMYVFGNSGNASTDIYVDGVNARIQFSDGSWWSCPVNTVAMTDHQYLYNATCEINNGMNLSVYKYGFNFNLSQNISLEYRAIAISQLSYFSNVSDFSTAINNQNTIIQNASNQAHSDHNEQMNYNENNIPQPDKSNTDDFQSGLDNILDNFDNIDYNSFNIYSDTNANTFIWNTATSLFNSHTLIFTLLLSILSIGIIKQLLGR